MLILDDIGVLLLGYASFFSRFLGYFQGAWEFSRFPMVCLCLPVCSRVFHGFSRVFPGVAVLMWFCDVLANWRIVISSRTPTSNVCLLMLELLLLEVRQCVALLTGFLKSASIFQPHQIQVHALGLSSL